MPAYREYLEWVYEYDSPDWSAEERVRITAYLDAMVDATHRALESCNYWRNDEGELRVECPEELGGVVACPHMWWRPEMFVVGAIPQRGETPGLCLEDVTIRPGRVCIPGGCDEGYVCSGDLTAIDDDYVISIPVCIERERCIELRDRYGLDPERSCLQANLEPAMTTTLPTVDCSELSEGQCASNCACADPGEQCQLVTETQEIGLCSPSFCTKTEDCSGDLVCAWNENGNFHWMMLDYLDSDFTFLYENYVVHGGVCVSDAACQLTQQMSSPESDMRHHNFRCSY